MLRHVLARLRGTSERRLRKLLIGLIKRGRHRFGGLVQSFVVTSFAYVIFFSTVFLVGGEGKYSTTIVLFTKFASFNSAPLAPAFEWHIYIKFSNTFNAVHFVINTPIPDHWCYGAASFDMLLSVQ